MNFDFKVTAWERFIVPKDQEKIILKAIEEGHIKSGDDIFIFAPDAENEEIDIASESLTPEENNGYATIEVYNDEGEIIYDNSIK